MQSQDTCVERSPGEFCWGKWTQGYSPSKGKVGGRVGGVGIAKGKCMNASDAGTRQQPHLTPPHSIAEFKP